MSGAGRRAVLTGRGEAGPPVLRRQVDAARRRPAIAFETAAAAAEWLVACHREVRDAGVLALIPTLGTVRLEEADAEDGGAGGERPGEGGGPR